MKSFTAETVLGSVKVRLPDEETPHVMKDGRTVAFGIPTTVPGPALAFPAADGGDPLVCVPSGQAEERMANSIDRTLTEPDEYGMAEHEVLTDVPVHRSPGVFAAEGLPVLWGARLGRNERTVTGFTFDDGVQTMVTWELDMIPAPRPRCCGRR